MFAPPRNKSWRRHWMSETCVLTFWCSGRTGPLSQSSPPQTVRSSQSVSSGELSTCWCFWLRCIRPNADGKCSDSHKVTCCIMFSSRIQCHAIFENTFRIYREYVCQHADRKPKPGSWDVVVCKLRSYWVRRACTRAKSGTPAYNFTLITHRHFNDVL